MRVFLKENWFGFGGVRYRKGFHDLPDDLCAVDEKGKFLHLPRSTTRDKPAEKKPFADAKEMKTLRDHDLERAGANAQADVERKAQAEADRIAQEQADANFVAAKEAAAAAQEEKAAAFRKQLEAEQANAGEPAPQQKPVSRDTATAGRRRKRA